MNPQDDEFQPSVQLPYTQFLYTIDQIAFLLNCTEKALYDKHLYYVGRDHGRPGTKLRAVNIAPQEPGVKADWRVAENDLVTWLNAKGVYITDQRHAQFRRRPVTARGRR